MCKQIVLVIGFAMSVGAQAAGTPNWGTDTHTDPAAANAAASWGAPPPKPQPAHVTKVAGPKRTVVVPPEIAALLQRPDTDVITTADGRSMTIKMLRAQVNRRRVILDALNNGKAPGERQRVPLAALKSDHHDELINASKLLKDTAKQEAAATWTSPGAIAVVRAPQGDPAAAWATPTTTSGLHASRLPTGSMTAPTSGPVLHSGIGSSTLSTGGSAYVAATSKPTQTQVSQQPSQAFVAQNIQPGIGIVNGHSTDVRFTPGGLYTVVGLGFGVAAGQADLIGPHLPGGRLELQVKQWQDRKMQVQLADGITGVMDQPVTLRVTTHDGTKYQMNVQFYATRQSITFGGMNFDVSQAFDMTLGNTGDWQDTYTNGGNVTRVKSGHDIGCPNPGQDSLRTKLPPGWTMADISINSWLEDEANPNTDLFGDNGDTIFSGNFSITQVPAGLTNQLYTVNWGVLRSHTSGGGSLFHGNDFGWNGNDGCASTYDVVVTVVGPAGLKPW